MKIPVSKAYLKQQLLSHSDYPSLLSITDTLDELGIDNAALVVEKEKLNEIPVPFLAHINSKGNDFLEVKNISTLQKDYPDFDKIWNGVVVVAEKAADWHNEENEKSISEKMKNFLKKYEHYTSV
ncbi:MAG: hypothetical protein B6D44_00280 [Ignavibacteriales bacterium UTCHB2]|nr:MAG: hypothetical protein B6D44_00280 [Ignavibacteriales bacterium UTCHB2]